MLKMTAAGLFVTDLEKMVAFYRDVMGMKTDWEGTPNAELYSGDMCLIMFGRKDFEEMTGRNFGYPDKINGTVELAFDLPSYEDVDREYQRVLEAGAEPVLAPVTEPWGQRTSYVADPDGNLIEIGSFGKE